MKFTVNKNSITNTVWPPAIVGGWERAKERGWERAREQREGGWEGGRRGCLWAPLQYIVAASTVSLQRLP